MALPRNMRTMARRKPLLIALALVAYLVSGFFSVAADESAVAFVFGRTAARDVLPGIHWNPPRPFGRVVVEKTATSFVMPIGFRYMNRADVPMVSDLWLTGDTNVLTARLNIHYSISSLADFVLNVENPRELIRRAGEQALSSFLVANDVEGLLTTERQRLPHAVRERIQETLDAHGSGVEVRSVSVQELAPPEDGAVRSAFQEVQNAAADYEKLIHDARALAAQTKANASAEAQSVLDGAESDAHARVAKSGADASRFTNLAAEHKKAPVVTEARLYLDAMDRLLPRLKTYVVEPGDNGKVNLRIVDR